MIFCTEDVRGQLLSDTQYANLTAVRTGRVYAINPNYMRWQGRTVYTASIEMMGLAYPELTESSTASVTVDLGTPTPEPSEEPSAEPSPSPAPEYTALAPGDESDEVLAMQARLSELGYLTVEYGGVYGDVTKKAVTAFQQANGLEANGEASVETLEKLFAEDAKPAKGAGT